MKKSIVILLDICLFAVGCGTNSAGTSESTSNVSIADDSSAEEDGVAATGNESAEESNVADTAEFSADVEEEPFVLPDDAVTFSLNETLEMDGVSYTFDEVRDQDGYEEIPAGEGKQYMALKFTVANHSGETFSFNFLTDLAVYCDGERMLVMEAGYLGDSENDQEAADWLVKMPDLRNGEEDSGWINLKVPENYEQLVVVFRRHMIEYGKKHEEGYFVYDHK